MASKPTMMRMIMGLDRPDAGRVRAGGFPSGMIRATFTAVPLARPATG
jgi:ABC-type transport system involved in cytochrome c biogenesis ATPase subunit